MSTAPLARDADVRRLLDDGYDINLVEGHLVVKQIPYVTADRAVAYGFLAYPVTVSGDRVVSGTDHRIWFGGSVPCNEHGQPLTLANPEARAISADMAAAFMLSSKPGPAGYPSEYEKVTAYARILAHPAMALDDTVTTTPGAAWQEVEDELPFRYRDTATSRAGLSALTRLFHAERIAIIGLGGTGAYILDQVAKTPVSSILLVDGDLFDNHNAFRAPGAASLEQLRERPAKVAYFADLYGQMHTCIATAQTYITDDNLGLLDDATFVFLAMDDATMKPAIAAYLLQRRTPFIDVGMGVEEIDSKLSGLLRIVFAAPNDHTHRALARIPKPAEERDDYGRNIQVADLNALNAMLAIGRWKRHLGFYADGTGEEFATYSMFANHITNETAGDSDAGIDVVKDRRDEGREEPAGAA
jgi:hypothetical protein